MTTEKKGLRWVVAVKPEAEALIAQYKLNRLQTTPFPVYVNADQSQWLILSGVGKTAAAAATAYLGAVSNTTTANTWINLGIAGHQELPQGTIRLAHKVMDGASRQSWYPSLVFKKPCSTADVLTVDKPEKHYPDTSLYDMEAAGFYAAAMRFTTQEMVHVVKIVSDNRTNPVETISPQQVCLWVNAQLPVIDLLVDQLLELSHQEQKRLAPPPEQRALLKNWHFSETQKYALEKLVKRYHAFFPHAALLQELQGCSSSRQVLVFLEKKLKQGVLTETTLTKKKNHD